MCTQFVKYNIKIHGKYTKQNVYEFEVTKLSCKSIMLCMPWYECVLAKSFFESYVNWSAWGDNIKTSHTIQQYNIKCYVKKKHLNLYGFCLKIVTHSPAFSHIYFEWSCSKEILGQPIRINCSLKFLRFSEINVFV